MLEIAHYLYDNKYVMIKISEKIANIRNRLNLLLANDKHERLQRSKCQIILPGTLRRRLEH